MRTTAVKDVKFRTKQEAHVILGLLFAILGTECKRMYLLSQAVGREPYKYYMNALSCGWKRYQSRKSMISHDTRLMRKQAVVNSARQLWNRIATSKQLFSPHCKQMKSYWKQFTIIPCEREKNLFQNYQKLTQTYLISHNFLIYTM